MSEQIIAFLQERQAGLRERFLKENEDSWIFEMCVLTYLEVEVVARGQNPKGMWDKWLEVVESHKTEAQKESGKLYPLYLVLGNTPEGRRKLAEELEHFANRFRLPRRGKLTPAGPPEPKPTPSGPITLEDWLLGDHDDSPA